MTADRELTRTAVLTAPDSTLVPVSMTASSGATPLICVMWGSAQEPQEIEPQAKPGKLTCRQGSSQPFVVKTRGVGAVALRADAGAIAWTERIAWPTYPTTNLVIATVDGPTVKDIRRTTSSTGCPAECFEGRLPGGVSWAGDAALLMSMGCESDDSCDLRRLPLNRFTKGWDAGIAPVRIPQADRTTYAFFDEVGTADDTTALVAERDSYMNEARLPQRGVRIDIATGRVLDVLMTARPGRHLVSITGGARGIVYVTSAGFESEDPRFYVRFPGETRGAPLRGVPADADQLVAVL